MNSLFSILLIIVKIIDATGEIALAWDDSGHIDTGCTFPEGIPFPQHMIDAVLGIRQGFKFYLNMANSAYYRWQHEKVTGANFSTVADIKLLKPKLIFPNLSGLVSLQPSYGKVWFYDSMEKYYKVWCTPLNLALTNATCVLTDASEGSKPADFGTGDTVATTILWADWTAILEYHCYKDSKGNRNVQICNVLSKNELLSQTQIDEITAVLVENNFNPANIMVYQNL